jgi:hypothetical protein
MRSRLTIRGPVRFIAGLAPTAQSLQLWISETRERQGNGAKLEFEVVLRVAWKQAPQPKRGHVGRSERLECMTPRVAALTKKAFKKRCFLGPVLRGTHAFLGRTVPARDRAKGSSRSRLAATIQLLTTSGRLA